MSADALTSSTDRPPLARTPLFDLHVGAGARMVGFAGYEMPVQYEHGVLYEHNHTRAQAGLFDVSHMGQALLSPNTGGANAALLMEKLVPGGISTLGEGRIRYTLLTHADGGIRDD
ncbi:MAG: glycine cleavage system aminomethyltransferase GcvT, partial [Pseudomonadota bacterium]|nr:glycine cleavage system aminomethyltransferase GcvT [Pseudomonadota bacterium]